MHRFGTRAARDIWWFFLFVLVCHTVIVVWNIYRTARDENRVNHTLQVLNLVNGLKSGCIDTETGARGFAITGDKDMLGPYEESQPAIRNSLNQLRQLTNDNADQLRLLDDIVPLVDQRLDLLSRLINERRKDAPNPVTIVTLVRDGKTVMDQLRHRIDAVAENERRLLDQREYSARSALRLSVFTTIFGGVASIGLVVLARWLMRREYETRRRGEAALRISNERFGILAETVPQIVWVARSDGQFEYFNQQWYDYTGSHQDANPIDMFSSIQPEDASVVRDRWRKSISSGAPFEVESRLRRHDGVDRWYLIRALAVRDASRSIVQWFGTCTDIEDQRQTRQQLENMVQERTSELRQVVEGLNSEIKMREQVTAQLERTAAELTRSNGELEQFAYVASHDLQEPLRKIQTFSDRLKSRFNDTIEGQLKDYVDRMQGAAGRMRQLINDLLSYSRVTTRPHSFAPVDLNIVVRDVIDDLEESISQSNAKIEVGSLPTIVADPLQMRQLFQNMISNALKFRKKEQSPVVSIGAEPGALITVSDQGDNTPACRISITDNGIGFDPSYSERIFQVFQRLHGRQEYEGTGIGLAVVRKIVERHGGTIVAHGRPDSGATFVITMPLRPHLLVDESSNAERTSETTIP